MAVERDNNRIVFTNRTESALIAQGIQLAEEAITERGYQEIELDFSKSTCAFASGILRLCSYVKLRTSQGLQFSLFFGENSELRRLFVNQNWASLLDAVSYPQSGYRGFRQVPAKEYRSPEEQQSILNGIMDRLISSYDDIDRASFASIEWALNEIMDNVLVHSDSPCGGLVTLQTFNNENKKIEFVVSDSGVGIPESLRPIYKSPKSDVDILLDAVQEGVTNGKGQGNGLFGSIRICEISGGTFTIDTGGSLLASSANGGIHVRPHRHGFAGTTVYASINANRKDILADALRFGGETHKPIDFIETAYEMHSDGEDGYSIIIDPKEMSVGSRISGAALRTKIENLLVISDIRQIKIDFSKVAIVSSSFADELIAKLFFRLGQDDFGSKVEVANAAGSIQSIIQKSIMQRRNAIDRR